MSTNQQAASAGPTQRPKSSTIVMKKKEGGGAAKLRKVTQIPQSVVKGVGLTLLDTINDTINESNQDQQRNVLNLVEALMKEIQTLKNFLKEERLNNVILAEYVTKQESTHKNEIKKIVEDLEKERLKRNELENLFQEFVLEAASKPIFASTKIKEKVEQLRSSVEPHEQQYKLSEEFNNFPNLNEFKEAEKIKLEQAIPEIEVENENSEPSQDSGADAEPEPEKPPEIQLKDIPSMVLVEPQVSGFKIENGYLTYAEDITPITDIANPPIIEPEKDIPYYQIYFHAKPHVNIIVEDPVKGIIVISIATGEDHEIFKQHGAIIRLDSGTFVLPLKSRHRKKKVLQHLQLSPNAVIKEIRDPAFQDTLKIMEQKEMQIRARYKFAVLYAKEGQSEAEMFNNVESSPDFEEFLSFLGEKVALQGWSCYSGGLDTKTNTTGTHSIFSLHKGLEIMFHVSTMIPCNEDDEVQVERKRHLGNDVVVLVFKEGNQPFSPKIIRSHFNCVFLVIQKLSVPNFPDTTETFYQLSVCSRDGIPPFPPYIQDPPIYRKNADFRTFLLHKMINGERQASQYAPEFNTRMTRARTSALLTLAKDFLKK